MRTQVRSLASLSGFRIRHCHELWCRSQMHLRSGVAVAVGGSCSRVLVPSLGTYICCRYSPKKTKKSKIQIYAVYRPHTWNSKIQQSAVKGCKKTNQNCYSGFPLWLLLRQLNLGPTQVLPDRQRGMWFISPAGFLVTWLGVYLVFDERLCLSPFARDFVSSADECVCGLGNVFKSFLCSSRIAPAWVQPSACTAPSQPLEVSVIPGRLSLAVLPWVSLLSFWLRSCFSCIIEPPAFSQALPTKVCIIFHNTLGQGDLYSLFQINPVLSCQSPSSLKLAFPAEQNTCTAVPELGTRLSCSQHTQAGGGSLVFLVAPPYVGLAPHKQASALGGQLEPQYSLLPLLA